MILTEFLNDGTLIKHYSDKGVMLLQVETGDKYSDPVDVYPCRYTYVETDELIDGDSNGIFITGDEFMAKVEEVL
jgi:hypothetical protein